MEASGLRPLPKGWECKIEPKTGRLYFINHKNKSTTWEDPRLISIPTPPYHIAVNQPTAYFEDGGTGHWCSTLSSIKKLTVSNRRGSSPRLGGSPKIAPSIIPTPRSKRKEQILLHVEGRSEFIADKCSESSSENELPPKYDTESNAGSPSSDTRTTAVIPPAGKTPCSSSKQGPRLDKLPVATQYISSPSHNVDSGLHERPSSARSFSSSANVPSSYLNNCDVDTAFKTVCLLFPTASETSVRKMFLKYHNRAPLVVSALQVEKHAINSEYSMYLSEQSPKKEGDTDTVITSIPCDSKSIGISSPMKMNSFTTGSPVRTGTPVSLLRYGSQVAPSSYGSQGNMRWGSPYLSPSPQLSLMNHTDIARGVTQKGSPKMKLKYLKGIFPAADEMILLDVLSASDNNVQKATEKLMKKGFTRTPPAKPARQKWLEVKSLIERRQRALDQQKLINQYHIINGEPEESPFPTPILNRVRPHPSTEEKNRITLKLKSEFENLPERFISWALEAAQFQEDKAKRLLSEVGPQTPEEFKPFIVSPETSRLEKTEYVTPPNDFRLNTGKQKGMTLSPITDISESQSCVNTPDSGYEESDQGKPRKKRFVATLMALKESLKFSKDYVSESRLAKGPNESLAVGSNPMILKSHYVSVRSSGCSKGPRKNLHLGPGACYSAQGPNVNLVKGPNFNKRLESSKSGISSLDSTNLPVRSIRT